MNTKLLHLIIILSFARLSSAVNILILEEIASPSHHNWFRHVIKALAARGYNLTIASPDKEVSSANIHYIHMEKVYDIFHTGNGSEKINFVELGNQNAFSQTYKYSMYSVAHCIGHLSSDGWNQLENYPDDFKFDLIIHDYIMGGCLIAFANKFENAPLIGMTALNDNLRVTSYIQSSIVPSLSPYLLCNLQSKTFLERIFNFLIHITDKICFNCLTVPKLTELIKEMSSFKDTPSLLELGRKSIIFITNYDPSVDGIQQIAPNVIPVGGLQINAPRALPKDLQVLADDATNGLVLFSLGTNVRGEMLGIARIKMILEAFRKLPKYTFLWKINIEEFPIPIPSNVVVRKWVPQNDVLAHNNTKVFITHAGLMSTQESIWHAVPMLGIPIFGDQFTNIRKSVDKGFADVLYINDLSTEILFTKLKNLLTQSKYQEKAKLASAAFRDQKETPMERALWWIDWVIRNPKSNHFKSSGQNLNFLQLESIDVIVSLTVAVFLSVYGFLWFLNLCLKCMFGDNKFVSGKSKID